MGKVSMIDVAKKVGVSRATVSYVINNIPNSNISETTKARVLQAVDELGYQVNPIAKSLRGGKSYVIGFITDNISDTPFIVDIIKGAQDEALINNKLLMLMDAQSNNDTEARIFKIMGQWQTSGIIYAATLHREITVLDYFVKTNTVLVDCFTSRMVLPSVVPNEIQGGYEAAKAIIDRGYKRIGFINGPQETCATEGRLQGFLQAMADSGKSFDENLLRYGNWWQESGYEAGLSLLSLPNPPDAIFCANDWMAMGLYDAAKKMGKNIPSDLGVIGFDNRKMIADHMHPGLTTIALPYYEMGKKAVQLLLDEKVNNGHSGIKISLDCPLVLRQSI